MTYLEKRVEEALRLACKKHGILCVKFTSPSRNHVPDRILAVKGLGAVLVECKRPGASPRPAQANEIEVWRAHSVPVYVVDTIESAQALVQQLLYVAEI